MDGQRLEHLSRTLQAKNPFPRLPKPGVGYGQLLSICYSGFDEAHMKSEALNQPFVDKRPEAGIESGSINLVF